MVNPKYAIMLEALTQSKVIQNPAVRDALASVDRRFFLKQGSEAIAYQDSPQSIGWGITISAPHMHAMALEQLFDHLQPGCKVLDVGSGSGFLTVAMAEMVGPTGKAVGIDHIDELVQWSHDNVRRAGKGELMDSGRLQLLVRDGFSGYTEAAPYDCIHVGAAPEAIPEALKQQLKPGGVLLLPVGPNGGEQHFVRVTREESGRFSERRLFGVRYVPLTTVEKQLAGFRQSSQRHFSGLWP